MTYIRCTKLFTGVRCFGEELLKGRVGWGEVRKGDLDGEHSWFVNWHFPDDKNLPGTAEGDEFELFDELPDTYYAELAAWRLTQ